MADHSQFPPRDDGSTHVMESNAIKLLTIQSILISLVIIVVGLRCWCRHVMLRAFQLDDAAMIIALALAIAGYVCFVKFLQWGGGRHIGDIPTSWSEQLNYWAFIQSPINNTGISMVKISITFFLKRFLQGKKLNWFLNGMICFVLAFIVATILTFVLSCTPMVAHWKSVPGASCWSGELMSNVGIINGAISIVTDIIFVAIPVHVVKGLQVNKRTRWTLIGIMSLGLVVPVATTARMVYGYLQGINADWTWDASLYMWLNIEVQVAIFVISLPTLRPLFSSVLRGSTSRANYYLKNQYQPPTASHAYARSQLRRSRYERQHDIPLDDWEKDKPEAYRARVVCTTSSKVTGDDGSEENILPPPKKGIQIMKTTEVTVI